MHPEREAAHPGRSGLSSFSSDGTCPLSGSTITITDFPADEPRRSQGTTTRRSERRGHGPRGPLLPPEVPRWKSRNGFFDAHALEAFAQIDQHWHAELAGLDLAVDVVPRMQLKAGETWPEDVVADGRIPLARLIPAGVDRQGNPTRSRIVVFRKSMERRAPSSGALTDVIYEVLVQLVALHLDMSPDEVDQGPPKPQMP